MDKPVTFRIATEQDLPAIIKLIADDDLGQDRESTTGSVAMINYEHAFQEILASPDYEVRLMQNEQELIGCFYIMYLPHLSFQGTKRAQLESIRVASHLRGQGFGRKLMHHAFECAQNRGCSIIQLTTNKNRINSHSFYDSVGLDPSHVGYKLYL